MPKKYHSITSDSGAVISDEWIALRFEETLEPDLPIVDAHHHLWDRADSLYLAEQFYDDATSGHNIEASVYVEARSMYRAYGLEDFKSVGEVEFANGMAAIGASGLYGPARMAAAIVGKTDLRLENVRSILEELALAGGSRFRGIRQSAPWTSDSSVSPRYASFPRGLLLDEDFRRGFRHLGELNLSFDVYVLHPQLGDVIKLARSFPETVIVLDHLGTPLGIGSYKEQRDEVFAQWRRDMTELAKCSNVSVKLSGLGMVLSGFGFNERAVPPDSLTLQHAWGPYILTAIELFGVERCMFASNFPPDKVTCSYGILWNAFKRIVEGFTYQEKLQLFNGTAKSKYNI